MSITFNIEQEDVALVLKPNGHIDVYCPDVQENAQANNMKLLRNLLISLVKETSEAEDAKTLLEEIDRHMLPMMPSGRTLH